MDKKAELQKYLKENFAGKKIRKLDFRDKSVYGWSSGINVYFEESRMKFKTFC